MKRWLLAVVLLLGPAVGLASADYIILKVDLNKLFNPETGKYDPKGQAGQPQPPVQPGDPKAGDGSDVPPQWAYAYLEQRKKVTIFQLPDPYTRYPYNLYKIDQRWGKAYLSLHAQFIGKHFHVPSAKARFEEKATAWKKGKTAETLLDDAEWALEHGLFAECERAMDELKALEPANPVSQAFQKTRAALNVAPTRDDPVAAGLVRELTKGEYKKVSSIEGHYTLLTNVKAPSGDPGVKRRLARMEETYKGFFYWFALKGRPLTQPNYRLMAVLVKTGGWTDSESADFISICESFDWPMLIGDGFTARRDNVMILASTCSDPVFQRIRKTNMEKLGTEYRVSSADLLGEPNLAKKRPDLGQKIPLMQLSTVLQHAVEEDFETATVTHEAARQLAAATGLIPRNVNTAEWARFGLASHFETAAHHFYTTIGGPNWMQLVRWRHLINPKKGTLKKENAKNILLDVVGDRYFQQAEHAQRQEYEIAVDHEALKPKVEKAKRLAQATAWSLTHFLARKHLDQLLAYYGELSNLPRDVEYNAEVLRGCFARAFDLLTKDPSGGPKPVLDMARVDKLAKEWFADIELRPIDVDGYEAEEVKRLEDEDNPPPPPKTDTNTTAGTNPNPGYQPRPAPGMRPGSRPYGPGSRPYGPGGRPYGPGGRPYGPGGRGGRPGGG